MHYPAALIDKAFSETGVFVREIEVQLGCRLGDDFRAYIGLSKTLGGGRSEEITASVYGGLSNQSYIDATTSQVLLWWRGNIRSFDVSGE